MIGRLRANATIAGMAPRLTVVLRQWMQYESQYPANWMPDIIKGLPRQVIDVIPAGGGVAEMKEAYGRSLKILLFVCGLVLLIACANVANLLLVRAVGRRGQTALRLAVGATRRQIVLQALAESVLLALGGGIAGLVVAMAAARLLLSLAFSSAKFLPVSVLPSLPVLGFACAASLLTALIFGAAPAWFVTRTDPAEALRGQGPRGHRPLVLRKQNPADRAGDLVRGPRRGRHHAFAKPQQPRTSGLRLSAAGTRCRPAELAAQHLHSSEARIDLSSDGSAPQSDPRCAGRGTRALQPSRR